MRTAKAKLFISGTTKTAAAPKLAMAADPARLMTRPDNVDPSAAGGQPDWMSYATDLL